MGWVVWFAGFVVVAGLIGAYDESVYGSGWVVGLLKGAGIGAGIAAIVLGIVAGIVQLEVRSCRNTATELGFESKWTAFTGCLVILPSGQVVPLDSVRYADLVDTE